MKKWMLFACALAVATPFGGAGAESKKDNDGNERARSILAQGTPPGDYKAFKRHGPPFVPPGPPPCAPPTGVRGDDCHIPASR